MSEASSHQFRPSLQLRLPLWVGGGVSRERGIEGGGAERWMKRGGAGRWMKRGWGREVDEKGVGQGGCTWWEVVLFRQYSAEQVKFSGAVQA